MARQSGRGLRWPLEFTVETFDGVPVLIATGRVSHASAAALTAAIDQAVASPPALAGLVLDLERVDYISSAGLLAIEAANGRCTSAGVDLVLVAPSEPVRIAMDLAGLLALMAIEPSRAEAAKRIDGRRAG